jgi:hypothetical protein
MPYKTTSPIVFPDAGELISSPASGKTIGEVVLYGIGEWCRLMIGVILPLLILAAMIEVWITPQVIFLLTR